MASIYQTTQSGVYLYELVSMNEMFYPFGGVCAEGTSFLQILRNNINPLITLIDANKTPISKSTLSSL
jgi:hypothetical protein